MSRLGKNPIPVPAGITVTIDGDRVTIKGTKGELSRNFRQEVVDVSLENNTVVVTPKRKDVFARSLWGTYASHITNMIHGVTEGYQKQLELQGVGYRWMMKGKDINANLGFSHEVNIVVPEGLEVTTEKNIMTIKGIDKEKVGAFAAKVRSMKKPEPYKGKGIRYVGEVVRRKQGKKNV